MDPFKNLASLLDFRMSGHAASALSGVPSELGTMTASGLKLDGFKHEIQDYLVADWRATLRLPAFTMTGTVTGLKDGDGRDVQGSGSFAFQAAEIEEAELMFRNGLKPGDRVLAVPVAGGSEAVVLCKVVKGNA